jgi:hypothetical protein
MKMNMVIYKRCLMLFVPLFVFAACSHAQGTVAHVSSPIQKHEPTAGEAQNEPAQQEGTATDKDKEVEAGQVRKLQNNPHGASRNKPVDRRNARKQPKINR